MVASALIDLLVRFSGAPVRVVVRRALEVGRAATLLLQVLATSENSIIAAF